MGGGFGGIGLGGGVGRGGFGGSGMYRCVYSDDEMKRSRTPVTRVFGVYCQACVCLPFSSSNGYLEDDWLRRTEPGELK